MSHRKCVDFHRNPKKIEIISFDENFDVPVEFDVNTQSNFNNGQAVSSTIDCTSSQIKHCSCEMLMQRVNLTYSYGTKEVFNRDRKKLPCLLMEGGCETTTLDSFAYAWYTPENRAQNQCELERTQMLTILMLARQNTMLAGYMLTGNRSMFPDTDGSVAWLYHCSNFLSPPRVLDKCYGLNPILFERTTKFVDAITRQTYYFASEIPCLGDYTNVFQLDLENDNSWYQISSDPMPFNKPLLFTPTELGHITQFSAVDTRRAGMFTPKQMKNFRDNIFRASTSDTVLKNPARTVLTQGNTVRVSDPGNLERLLCLDGRLLMDHLLTPSFFVDNFKEFFVFWDSTFNVWEIFLLVFFW